MPLSNYVIRRYTPPTCTLEVLAQNSALSRWGGKAVLKQLRFELRFDDPRLPEEKRMVIRGNQDQLDALCTVVTNYVHELLQKSSENFWVSSSEPQPTIIASDASQTQDFNNDSSRRTNILDSDSSQIQGAEIHIQPSNRLIHDLFLGSLANQGSGDVVQLSLLQLFDLSTALDEYSADVLALPNLNTNRETRSLPSWVPVAAVLVLAVGLAPVTWQYAQSIRQKQQTAKKPTQPEQKIALEPSPSLSTPTPSPLLTPPDSLLLQQKPLLGSKIPLLGTPVLLTPQAPPKSSFPSVSQNSTLSKASLPSPKSNTLTIPGTASQTFPELKKTPHLARQNPKISNQPNLALNRTGLNSQPQGSLLQVPSQPNLALNSNGLNSQESPQISSQPNLKQSSNRLISKGGNPLPGSEIISSNQLPSTSSAYPDISKVPPPLATMPNLSTGDGINPANSQPDPSMRNASKNSLLVAKLRGYRRNTSTQIATGTLFDTTQVAEARALLKKHWQPPTELTQTLEYSLVLGVDGSIEQILPLGKASRDYIDRTGMPLIGERFVSPNKNGQAVRIRALFSPDGKVQTFPETQ
ncbi:MAG: DUF4335 domain-containing protein [Stigonema ocellatum SAG 48.90 = DSM 106950]|nr:DUF4335 domain-containing protein [Stigonema ocellatum SAG 48.90 = DSM 106950]